MNRHVTSLPIANHLKNKLIKNGVESITELKNLKPTDLIKDFGISKNEVLEIYETLDLYQASKPISVYDLLQIEQKLEFICSFSPAFDKLLGGGVPIGKITELCGAAGAGKTQVCMQLCVNVQIPETFGGRNAKAIFIDTEGSFTSNRIIEIVKSTQNLLVGRFNLINREELIKHNFSVEKVLQNIYYYRCSDHVQLLACFNNVKVLIDKQPSIKLVIIDSLAYPFRFVDFKDSNLVTMKTNILNNMMTIAYQLITKFNLAILITNQMTTRITRDSVSNVSSSNLVPALGETWAHSANLRILLSWRNSKRQACVCKSSYLPDMSCFYKITERGIEDEFDNLEDFDKEKKIYDGAESSKFQIKRKKIDD